MPIPESLDEFCRQRWVAGRAARGLAPDAPFEGDPLIELAEELADAWNYIQELVKRRCIELILIDALIHIARLPSHTSSASEAANAAVEFARAALSHVRKI